MKPIVHDIGIFNYLKTVFLGKGFHVEHISKSRADERSFAYKEYPSELLSAEEKGLLSISKGFIILSYLDKTGKRQPIFIKRCRFVPDETAAIMKMWHYDPGCKTYEYIDEDGWKWSLAVNDLLGSKRRTLGTGSVLVEDEKGKGLFSIQLI